MAATLRIAAPSICRMTRLLRLSTKKIPAACYSSTSKKVQQSGYVVGEATEVDPKRVQEIIDEGKRSYDEHTDINSPYYVSWGFDETDNFVDLWSKRLIMFFGISLVMVMGPIYYHYLPDPKAIKWTLAEAEIVLSERREAGVPLISPDYVPLDRFTLSDDGESSH